ncbi:MAG: thioredoxin domain-containing protein [Microbacterium sp.]|uniref:DsbA family protein n=1 Tax=Microbacterium sp. TaxID=51671 RepID=UPI0039E59A77
MATAARRNWFAIWVSIVAVAAIVAVGVLVVWMNNLATDPGEQPQGAIVDQDTGAITFGSGSNTVDTYIDFMCPYCQQFEEAEGKDIRDLVADGSITLNLHPVAILDRLSSGTEYSSRAASAMYAVAAADPDNAYAFMQAMYENQPLENSTGLTDEEIVQIARDAGVDVTSELETAITSHEYIDFAQSQQLPDGATGTPTLVVNGELVDVTMDVQTDIVDRLE